MRAVTRGWLEHTYDVRFLLGDILRRVGDLETGARGYALTAESDYLEPMLAARDLLDGLTTALSAKVADDASQFGRAQQLSELIRQRVIHAQGMVDLARERSPAGEIARYARGGKILTDRIRGLMAGMLVVEDALLTEHLATHLRNSAGANLLAWLHVGLQIMLWAVLFVVVRQALRDHAIVTVCSWSKTIRYEDEWITFEDYLGRRFGVKISHGISPAETEKFLRTLPGATPNEGAGTSSR